MICLQGWELWWGEGEIFTLLLSVINDMFKYIHSFLAASLRLFSVQHILVGMFRTFRHFAFFLLISTCFFCSFHWMWRKKTENKLCVISDT